MMRMVESKTRKAVFLTEAVRHLHIADASVETARFEQLLSRPDLHEAADLVTVRAVRVEARTLMTLQAFLKPAGQLFWFRSAAGPSAPSNVPPPLRWMATHPLVDANSSRLVVLSKDLVALTTVFHVEQRCVEGRRYLLQCAIRRRDRLAQACGSVFDLTRRTRAMLARTSRRDMTRFRSMTKLK